MSGYIERIRDTLDGKNVEALLTELGTRFHRVIYEHLLQFQINSVGKNFLISFLIFFSHFLLYFFLIFSSSFFPIPSLFIIFFVSSFFSHIY